MSAPSASDWPPRMPVSLGDRSGFPQLEARAYLAHSAISPLSTVVRAATDAVFDDYARRGVHAFMTWHGRREGLRATLAELVGARREDVGFVANTTAGVSTIALCLDWKPGETVVVLRGEFPTNVTPWQRAAELFDLELEFLDVSEFAGPSGTGLQRLEDRLARGGVRLIAVSAVQFQTGLRMPLKAMASLAHDHGAELFCDGIQAAGVLELDLPALGVDYFAAGSHKWLMGPEGCAMLYVAPERVAALKPRTAGWLSHEDPVEFLFKPDTLRYDRAIRQQTNFVEAGAYPTALLAGLEAAATCLLELGPARIEAHVQAYLDTLEAGLVARGFTSLRSELPEQRSAILSLRPPPGHEDLGDLSHALDARGVVMTTPDGCLRVAPHWPNALDEIDFVLGVVDELL